MREPEVSSRRRSDFRVTCPPELTAATSPRAEMCEVSPKLSVSVAPTSMIPLRSRIESVWSNPDWFTTAACKAMLPASAVTRPVLSMLPAGNRTAELKLRPSGRWLNSTDDPASNRTEPPGAESEPWLAIWSPIRKSEPDSPTCKRP